MFKQIFRVAFVTLVWKQYKRAIVSTILLFAYLWLVGSVHEDYLSYIELQNDSSLAARSFIMKWAAFVAGVLLYLAYHLLRGPSKSIGDKTSEKELTPPKSAADEKKKGIMSRLNFKSKPVNESTNNEEDPFNALRNKDKLRSRAEIMIDKKGQ